MDDLLKSIKADGSFRYFAPVSFFEKADAPEGQTRRFGGIATTEARDQDGEVILQRGLDWDYFMTKGWFNDNHGRKTGDIVGYPAGVQFYKKGQRLPDGNVAEANLHWTEGYLLDGHKPADEIWSAALALKKAGGGRQLGQSIEGKIQRRSGDNNKTIAKATVRNVAITHCPVNAETNLGFLAKAIVAAETKDTEEEKKKALAMGPVSSPPTPPAKMGPQTGAGAGRVLATESLERELKNTTYKSHDRDKRITKGEAFDLIASRFPGVSGATVGRILDLTFEMKRKGAL